MLKFLSVPSHVISRCPHLCGNTFQGLGLILWMTRTLNHWRHGWGAMGGDGECLECSECPGLSTGSGAQVQTLQPVSTLAASRDSVELPLPGSAWLCGAPHLFACGRRDILPSTSLCFHFFADLPSPSISFHHLPSPFSRCLPFPISSSLCLV